MKNFILLALLISQVSYAQSLSKKELVKRSLEERFYNGKMIFPLSAETLLEWNKVFDEQNLKRDRNKIRNDYRLLFPIADHKVHRITGKRIYYGLFPKKYRYTIEEDPTLNRLIVKLKIHFYPSKTYKKKSERLHRENDPDKKYYPEVPIVLEKMKNNLKESENIWNRQAPEDVAFHFEYAEKASDADYSIKLVTHLGALYDRFIYANYGEDVLAHEIGHMLGLDDEYSMVTSNILNINTWIDATIHHSKHRGYEYSAYQDMRCHLESIMCLKETLYPYHFDHILGRIEDH